jgi:hypothetical protein
MTKSVARVILVFVSFSGSCLRGISPCRRIGSSVVCRIRLIHVCRSGNEPMRRHADCVRPGLNPQSVAPRPATFRGKEGRLQHFYNTFQRCSPEPDLLNCVRYERRSIRAPFCIFTQKMENSLPIRANEIADGDLELPTRQADPDCSFFTLKYGEAFRQIQDDNPRLAKTYQTLAILTSFFPNFDSPAEPYRPMFIDRGRRSSVPDDLTEEDLKGCPPC